MKKTPWLVRMHYRMRAGAFAMMFVATALHAIDRDYGLSAWAALIALFLIYPSVQYWRARRAADPLQVEMQGLLLDSFLLGAYAAGMAFSPWLSFSVAIGSLSNNVANKGWRGGFAALLGLLAGALLWIAIFGFSFSPFSNGYATAFCICGLSLYLLAMNNLGFTQNRQLRLTREKLLAGEKSLIDTNQSLLSSLHEIDELHQQLREQANRDPLTNLYNRRYLDSTLEREVARCRREGQALALFLIDIDHFKGINDTYGHQAGDQVLIQFGEILAGMARAGDVACRYGGEEFLLLMPTMLRDPALARAEQLRAAFSALAVRFGDFELRATLSIGIAVYPGHGISADELIRHADRALYLAKSRGRDRVEVAALETPL